MTFEEISNSERFRLLSNLESLVWPVKELIQKTWENVLFGKSFLVELGNFDYSIEEDSLVVYASELSSYDGSACGTSYTISIPFEVLDDEEKLKSFFEEMRVFRALKG
jgi:hypothetical protein